MTSLEQDTLAPRPDPRLPARRARPAFRGVIVAVAALVGLTSFIIFIGLTPIAPTHRVVVGALLADAVAIMCLAGVLVWEVAPLIRRRREAEARARLRAGALFALMAAIPAVMIALAAEIAIYRAFDALFSRDMRTLVVNSYGLAAEQVHRELSSLGSVALQLSQQIDATPPQLGQDHQALHQFLNAQSSLHHVPVIVLVTADGSVIDRADANGVDQPVSLPALTAVSDNEPRLAMPRPDVAAGTIRLRGHGDTYLYVSRAIDPGTFNRIESVQEAAEKYSGLQNRRFGIQLSFALLFTAISLIGLLSTLWIGLRATRYAAASAPRYPDTR